MVISGAFRNFAAQPKNNEIMTSTEYLKIKDEALANAEQMAKDKNLKGKLQIAAFAYDYGFEDGQAFQERADEKKYRTDKKMMREQLIEKACEWLKSYRQETPDGLGYIAGIVNDKTIEEFRKAMDDEYGCEDNN